MLPAEMTQRQFVTELARLTESDVWPALLPWFKRRCADRVLEARFAEDVDKARASLQAAGDLILAIENEVTQNRGLIDGRKTRHEREKNAAPAERGAAKRGNRSAGAG